MDPMEFFLILTGTYRTGGITEDGEETLLLCQRHGEIDIDLSFIVLLFHVIITAIYEAMKDIVSSYLTTLLLHSHLPAPGGTSPTTLCSSGNVACPAVWSPSGTNK